MNRARGNPKTPKPVRDDGFHLGHFIKILSFRGMSHHFCTMFFLRRRGLKMHRFLFAGLLCTAVFATACHAGQTKVIKVGHTGTSEHHYQMYLEKWSEIISRRTDGRY
jgi:hypothetical protein